MCVYTMKLNWIRLSSLLLITVCVHEWWMILCEIHAAWIAILNLRTHLAWNPQKTNGSKVGHVKLVHERTKIPAESLSSHQPLYIYQAHHGRWAVITITSNEIHPLKHEFKVDLLSSANISQEPVTQNHPMIRYEKNSNFDLSGVGKTWKMVKWERDSFR